MSVDMVAACKKLDYTGAKRVVLMEYADHANDDGICWPSRSRIMYNTGLSESAVKQQTKELREAEVIMVVDHHEGGRGRIPIYKVQPEKGPHKVPFKEWCEEHLKGSKGPPPGSKGVTEYPQNRKGNRKGKNPSVPEGDAGASSATLVAYLAEELEGHDIPLMKGRKGRYGKDFATMLEKGVEPGVMWKVADRIIERWKDDNHHKLQAEDALADVVNGKPPAHVVANGSSTDGASNSEEAARRRREGYEWLFDK